MITKLNEMLYKLDEAATKIAKLSEKDFKQELATFVASIPKSKYIDRYKKIMVDIANKRAKGEDIEKLKFESIDLLNAVPRIPELRTFRKLAEFLLERLTEAVLNTEEPGNKVTCIDVTYKEINLRTTITSKPQVDSIEGVASTGVSKDDLQKDIKIIIDSMDISNI